MRFEEPHAWFEHRRTRHGEWALRAACVALLVAWVAGCVRGLAITLESDALLETVESVEVGAFLLAPVLALSSWISFVALQHRDVAVRVLSHRALEYGASRVIEPASIVSAVHEQDGVVAIDTREGVALRIGVGSVERADALLDALDQGPASRRARLAWTIASERWEVFWPTSMMLATVLALGALYGPPVFEPLFWRSLFSVPWALGGWRALHAGRRAVEIGADAIVVRASGAPDRTLRFGDLESRADALALVPSDVPGDVRRAIERRIDAALAMLAARHDEAAFSALLALGGRSFDAWHASLASIRDGRATLRAATITPARLATRLGDPAAPPDQRVGAALALLALDRDEALRRVRTAAETTAAPALRVALEAVLDGTLDAAILDAALRERPNS
ncbi:Hypothetical protein I5071_39650 [Sandaracinus amylolyticus]|nr:Hypothetical protein I5071_39650 [Sandaracinus amylolyticus]